MDGSNETNGTNLAPPWCTEPDGEYEKQPRVGLTEMRKSSQQETPNADEERDYEQKDLPFGNSATPQESPIPSMAGRPARQYPLLVKRKGINVPH